MRTRCGEGGWGSPGVRIGSGLRGTWTGPGDGGCGSPGVGIGIGGPFGGAFTPGEGGCGSRRFFVAEKLSGSPMPAASPAGKALSSSNRSTMLPPRTPKARCATVSPIAEAMTALTASCVSGFSAVAAFACCRRVQTSARSCALRIRSSRINVSEKESRICFGVIGDTPPRVCANQNLGSKPTPGEEAQTIYRVPVNNQENSAAGS